MSRYVLLSGGDGGWGNLGDEFILDAALTLHTCHDLEVIVLMQKPRPVAGMRVVGDDAASLAAAGVALSDVACIHYYGGGYLNDYWYESKMWLFHAFLAEGHAARRVVFSGQGVGPLTGPHQSELQGLSSRVGYFGVRDRRTPRWSFSFDDTIALRSTFPPPRQRISAHPRILLNIRTEHYVGATTTQLVEVYREALRYADTTQSDIAGFAMVGGKYFDERATVETCLADSGLTQVSVLGRPGTYSELLSLIGGDTILVTTSYHAALAALYTHTPVLCLYFNDYYREKFLGLEECASGLPLLVSDFRSVESLPLAALSETASTMSLRAWQDTMDLWSTAHERVADELRAALRD